MSNKNPNRENLTPFKKGQSGNPKGRPKLPDLTELMDKILGEEKDGRTAAETIIAALKAKAARGDIRAAELLFDRAYGKAKASLDIGINIPSAIRIIRDKDV